VDGWGGVIITLHITYLLGFLLQGRLLMVVIVGCNSKVIGTTGLIMTGIMFLFLTVG
jgi:hypothetical protein